MRTCRREAIEKHYRRTGWHSLTIRDDTNGDDASGDGRLSISGTVHCPPGTPLDANWCTFLDAHPAMRRLYGNYETMPDRWLRLTFHDVERGIVTPL